MGVGGRLYIRVYGVVLCLYRGMGELLLKEGRRCDGVKRGGLYNLHFLYHKYIMREQIL